MIRVITESIMDRILGVNKFVKVYLKVWFVQIDLSCKKLSVTLSSSVKNISLFSLMFNANNKQSKWMIMNRFCALVMLQCIAFAECISPWYKCFCSIALLYCIWYLNTSKISVGLKLPYYALLKLLIKQVVQLLCTCVVNSSIELFTLVDDLL